MKVVVSWIRVIKDTHELLLVSDSWLSSLLEHVDYFQELFSLS